MEQSGLFHKIEVWNHESLERAGFSYYQLLQDLIRSYPKGYGLWSWKLPILDHVFSRLNPGEFLVYLDVGSTLNFSTAAKIRFEYYIELAMQEGGVFFQQDLVEWQWSKSALREYFSEDKHWSTGQLLGGIQILHRTEKTETYLSRALAFSLLNGGQLLKDPESHVGELLDFRAHRHDQSLISLCAKEAGMAILQDETYFAPDWEVRGFDYPIWASRLCSGNPDLSGSLRQRIRHQIERRLP